MFGGIPDTINYTLPTVEELPPSSVDWKLDPDRSALLIHDMQGYFLRSLVAGETPYRAVVANIAALRSACVEVGAPVCYTAQPGGMSRQERGLLRDIWGNGMSKDAVDRDVIDDLAPGRGDRIFTKWRYSAFHSSDLLGWMREQGRDQLIVTGVYAHVGVLITTCEAYSHDIETFLPADAVADFTREDHELALRYAAARCALVRPAADFVGSLLGEFDPEISVGG